MNTRNVIEMSEAGPAGIAAPLAVNCAGVKAQPRNGDHRMTLPEIARDPFSRVQIRMGVMGSAGTELDEPTELLCRDLGRAIAERGCCLLTRACPGMPHAVVLGCKESQGHVVGISPGASLREHVESYGSPNQAYDVLIFTGLGLMGRELVSIRSSDIVIVVGGRSGTKGEFAIAYEEGKLMRRWRDYPAILG